MRDGIQTLAARQMARCMNPPTDLRVTATGETWTAMLDSYLDTAIGIRNGANGAEYA